MKSSLMSSNVLKNIHNMHKRQRKFHLKKGKQKCMMQTKEKELFKGFTNLLFKVQGWRRISLWPTKAEKCEKQEQSEREQ